MDNGFSEMLMWISSLYGYYVNIGFKEIVSVGITVVRISILDIGFVKVDIKCKGK